jgi:hypothetical protein
MRKRYVTSRNRPRLYSYDDEPIHLAGTTVFEQEPMIFGTGLLDADGQPIWYEEIKEPIGFVHAQSECS